MINNLPSRHNQAIFFMRSHSEMNRRDIDIFHRYTGQQASGTLDFQSANRYESGKKLYTSDSKVVCPCCQIVSA